MTPPPTDEPTRRAPPAWAVVVAVLAVVVGTTTAFVLGTTHQGAGSPEEAVEDLVAALEAGDALGVLEVLPPGERDAVAGSLPDILVGLQDGGAVGGTAGMDGVLPGVAVDVEGMVLRTEALDPQVSFVEVVDGTIEVRVDEAAVPDPEVRAELARATGADVDAGLTWRRDLAEDPLVLGTVDEGGGWFVSIGYTTAEQVRRASGAPLPDTETRPDAIGSSTPSEVVADLLGAAEARFPLRFAELLWPEEGRAAYDYATVWLPGMQAAADRAGADQAAGRRTWVLVVDDLVTREEGEGDVRRVVVERLDATLLDGYALEVVRIVVGEDGCTTWTTTPAPGVAGAERVRRVCPGVGWTDGAGRPVAPEGVGLTDLLTLDGLGAAQPSVTVVERGGRWFLSPTRTVLDGLAEGLGAVDPATGDPVDAGAWGIGLAELVLRAVDGPTAVRRP